MLSFLSTAFSSFLRTLLEVFVDGLFRWVVGVLSVLCVLITPFDTYDFWHHPQDYAIGQDLDVSQPHWQGQYVLRNGLMFIVAGLVLWLLVVAYRRPQQRLLRNSCRIVVTLVVAKLVVGFFQAASTGFDH